MRSLLLLVCAWGLSAQAQAPAPGQPIAPQRTAQAPAADPDAVLSLDLASALQRARDYNQQFMSAGISASLAHEDRVQARAAMLPSLNALNQYIYTQGNGTPSGVFVANDGVHIYNEQAVVHAEVFSVARRADWQRAVAAEAAARARVEVAGRGLVATVVQGYYGLILSRRHEANARRSADEASQFLDLTRKQERGGEVARADVIKAEIQQQQRLRDLLDAETATQKARIALAVLLFPDVAQRFDIEDDLKPELTLPALDEVRSLALSSSPDVRAAEFGVKQADAGILGAKAALYPSLVVDYFYGIDANVFGIHGPEGRKNLGSVVQGTVVVPVWNWGAQRSKVRQAELQKRQAQFDLTFAQRSLASNIAAFHLEAQTARAQLASLRGSLDLSNESLRLTILRYQAGEATALEVVDAQSTLAAARNAYDDGLARYRVALALLGTLTGRF